MNRLEKALLDPENRDLDVYLEIEPTAAIRKDIEEMMGRASDLIWPLLQVQAIKKILSMSEEELIKEVGA